MEASSSKKHQLLENVTNVEGKVGGKGGMEKGISPPVAAISVSVPVSQTSESRGEGSEKRPATIRMRPSSFQGIPSTVFFDYPTELVTTRNDVSVVETLDNRKLRYDTHW